MSTLRWLYAVWLFRRYWKSLVIRRPLPVAEAIDAPLHAGKE